MSTTNLRSLKKIAAGTTFAFLVTAALFFQHGESVANHFGAPTAARPTTLPRSWTTP